MFQKFRENEEGGAKKQEVLKILRTNFPAFQIFILNFKKLKLYIFPTRVAVMCF